MSGLVADGLAARPGDGGVENPRDQHTDQVSPEFGGAAHVGDRCGNRFRRHDRLGDRFLIERLADQIAMELLDTFPLKSVEVVVHKASAPVGSPVEDIAVRIMRKK